MFEWLKRRRGEKLLKTNKTMSDAVKQFKIQQTTMKCNVTQVMWNFNQLFASLSLSRSRKSLFVFLDILAKNKIGKELVFRCQNGCLIIATVEMKPTINLIVDKRTFIILIAYSSIRNILTICLLLHVVLEQICKSCNCMKIS